MASRGACPRGAGPRPSISRPAMTRTQMLRAAQTSAVVQRETVPETSTAKRGACPARSRTRVSRSPKKVDYAAPGMTKAMQMRRKAAEDKMRMMEAAKSKAESTRRPRRTPAPIGGDARLGRQRACPASARKSPEEQLQVLETAIARGHVAGERRGQRPTVALDAAINRGHIVTERSCPKAKRSIAGPSGIGKFRRPTAAATPVPEDTKELAKLMNAEIVTAVPISDGPVNKIIIDPGAVSADRSTIVCIPEAEGAVGGSSEIANKSIQAISETLDQQDAAESAAVQGKLEELQNARREFVIAVANVGGNAVNVHEESGDSILDLDEIDDQLEYMPSPPRQRQIYKMPDVSHPMFQVEYGRDHPQVEAARKFSRKTQMSLEQMQAQKRIEDQFERLATQQMQDFDLDVPLEQDIQDADISWEEDDQGTIMPCPSRIKASMRVPRREASMSPIRGANVEDIERFFDLQNYPPEDAHLRPPPGREGLNPDLWYMEDPWYIPPPVTDEPLIHFDTSC